LTRAAGARRKGGQRKIPNRAGIQLPARFVCFLDVSDFQGDCEFPRRPQGIQRIARDFLDNSGGNFLRFLLKPQRAHGSFFSR
jgi:hypothetical protein